MIDMYQRTYNTFYNEYTVKRGLPVPVTRGSLISNLATPKKPPPMAVHYYDSCLTGSHHRTTVNSYNEQQGSGKTPLTLTTYTQTTSHFFIDH